MLYFSLKKYSSWAV